MDVKGENGKLDWMYKGANSLINREEYLLGKAVDKPLEQLNNEEKEKRLGLVPPKNHVEHECIPPSIRDYNKIVQAEQVDLSAKLQEDPLVAIRKQEEEARRQFLQNPVQLKKLQEALKAQEMKKKKKHKKSSHDLDEQLKNKLKKLRNSELDIGAIKKHKNDDLDIILMHKFNQLKDKLSQSDINDILAGKVSDSEEDNKKKDLSDDSDEGNRKFEKKCKYNNEQMDRKSYMRKSRRISEESDTKYESRKRKSSRERRRDRSKTTPVEKNKRSKSSSSSSDDDERKGRRDRRNKNKFVEKNVKFKEKKYPEQDKNAGSGPKIDSDISLDRMILEKLRMLRNSQPDKKESSESDEEPIQRKHSHYDSDNDEYVPKKKAFGLVRSDGTKIPLKKNSESNKIVEPAKQVEVSKKPERKQIKKLTEEEKEERRRQMMKDASKRETERSQNLKKYRQEEEREKASSSNFDRDFVHKELLKSTKNATVETRLRSNLNNIQRSSQHMNSNFSKR